MSDVAKRLVDLWEIDEAERAKGIKLLQKVYGNILANPNDPKFRDLNFSKIRKKLDQCRPAFYLLFTAGFSQSVDGQRLQWQYNNVTIKLLQTASNALNAKINGETIDDGQEYGGIVAPEETNVIKDRNMMIHRKKKEKEKALKAAAAAEADAVSADQPDAAPSNEVDADSNMKSENDDDPKPGADADGDVNPDAADNEPKGDDDGDGDVEMKEEPKGDGDEVANELAAAGLDDDDLKLLEQIKAAKGITVTLKAADLKGLSKEEKIAKFKETQDQYRKEKQQNVVKMKLDKEKRRREGIKKQQEAERKRKEYELRMVAQRKKREKAEADRRKKRIKEKIAADKKRRAEQREREKKKKEAEKAAKLKAAEADQ